MYQPPATKVWLNVSDAVIVQGMLPNTCRVVVAEAVLLPRRVRGHQPATGTQDCLRGEAAPQDDKVEKLVNVGSEQAFGFAPMSHREAIETALYGEPLVCSDEDESKERVIPHTFLKGSSPEVAKQRNVGRDRVCKAKRIRPIVKARAARKRRQDKGLLPIVTPAAFGADNPPDPPTAANNTTPNESNLHVGVLAYSSPGLGTH